MSDYYDEPVPIHGLGSISHLSDVRSRKRKQPLGFVANESRKQKPKRPVKRKAKR